MSRFLALGACAALAASAVAFAQSAPPSAAPPAEAPLDAPPADPGAPAEAAPSSQAKAPFHDLRRLHPIQGNVAAGQTKSEVCSACHGPTGTAIAPIFPNLAGQSANYLYWELVEYKDGALPESPMAPLVATLSDQDMRDLAAYFSAQAPVAPAADAAVSPPDPVLLEHGERLYLSGDPSKGIPPCQGCHGTDARGHALAAQPNRNGQAPYAIYPALRGQQSAYLQTRLAAFRDGGLAHSSNDHVMSGVGARLDDESIRALSAWLNSLQ